jgi:hypothetical protein
MYIMPRHPTEFLRKYISFTPSSSTASPSTASLLQLPWMFQSTEGVFKGHMHIVHGCNTWIIIVLSRPCNSILVTKTMVTIYIIYVITTKCNICDFPSFIIIIIPSYLPKQRSSPPTNYNLLMFSHLSICMISHTYSYNLIYNKNFLMMGPFKRLKASVSFEVYKTLKINITAMSGCLMTLMLGCNACMVFCT